MVYAHHVLGVHVGLAILNNVIIIFVMGLSFFLEGGSQIYKKLASMKLQPPYFKKFYDPASPIHLTPKQAKIVLKSVFLNKNKHTICGHLVTPYILDIKNFDPLFSFPKIYDPQYVWDPLPKKTPLMMSCSWSSKQHDCSFLQFFTRMPYTANPLRNQGGTAQTGQNIVTVLSRHSDLSLCRDRAVTIFLVLWYFSIMG